LPSEDAPAPAGAGLIAGRYFDGRSSRPVPCLLRLVAASGDRGVGLRLHAPHGPDATLPGALIHEFAAGNIEWPDAGQTRIAVVRFTGGGLVQAMEPAQLADALRKAGWRAPGMHAAAHRMASSWRALLAGVAVCTALSLAVWLYGVPAASTLITRVMPARWETELGSSTLEALDKTWLSPSKLEAARQAQITADFDALVKKAGLAASAPRYQLVFRSLRRKSSDAGGGANAFALPGGTLVMTDELVALAEPGAVLGVLAHELGHVQHRHATRIAVEGSLLGAAVALISGDVTSVVATLPVALVTLSFSRSHETESDCYAIALLARAGESPEPLARLLESIARPGAGMAGVLSSHPGTPERVQLLRGAPAGRNACGG
jgi:Zn-dependent protease with chaperone function